jgi:transcriptional regulator with XRE-family HTH domain
MSPRSFKLDSSLTSLGEVVKALRAEAGLTQEGLAERAGVDATYVGHIERGERNLTWAALSRLSKGLGVPRWVLVKRVDELGRGWCGPRPNSRCRLWRRGLASISGAVGVELTFPRKT